MPPYWVGLWGYEEDYVDNDDFLIYGTAENNDSNAISDKHKGDVEPYSLFDGYDKETFEEQGIRIELKTQNYQVVI